MHVPVNMWDKHARRLIGFQMRYKEVLQALSYYKQEIENYKLALTPFLLKAHENEMYSSGHTLRLQKNQKFNLSKFRNDHPDMYELYCSDDYKIKIEVEND